MMFDPTLATETALVLPAAGFCTAAPGIPGRAARRGSAGSVARAFTEAAADLKRRAAVGDTACATALSLLPPAFAVDVTTIAAGRPAALQGPVAIGYDYAAEMMQRGRSLDATFALALVLCLPGGRLPGLVGLAVCALRSDELEASLLLATESLKLDVKHPRACCIAGLCSIELGDRRAGQAFLAATARLARDRPEHRDDLQIAQRALLLMHLARD